MILNNIKCHYGRYQGTITVKDSSVLDREERDVIYLTVKATDSPKDLSVSRSSEIPVCLPKSNFIINSS